MSLFFLRLFYHLHFLLYYGLIYTHSVHLLLRLTTTIPKNRPLPKGRDVNLDVQRVVGYRNFCNKLWNATRFALRNFGDFDPSNALSFLESLTSVPAEKQAPRDAWILSRLANVIATSIATIESYEFGKLTTAVYSFGLYDLCDNYLELTKPIFSNNKEDAKQIRRRAQEVGWYLLMICGMYTCYYKPMLYMMTYLVWCLLYPCFILAVTTGTLCVP